MMLIFNYFSYESMMAGKEFKKNKNDAINGLPIP